MTWRWRTERFPEAGCYSRCIAKAQVLTSCHAFQELHHLQQDHINTELSQKTRSVSKITLKKLKIKSIYSHSRTSLLYLNAAVKI